MADPRVAPLVNTQTGERLSVPAADAQKWLSEGKFRRETREEYSAAETKAAATAGTMGKVDAVIEGGLRSATFGLTDLAAQESLTPKQLEDRRNRAESPWGEGGEFGVDVLSTVASGGVAGLAKQAGKRALGAAAKEGVEEVVERGVREVAEEGLEQTGAAVAKSLPRQAAQAVATAGEVALKVAPGTVVQAGTQLLGEGVEAGLKRVGAGDMLSKMGGMAVEGGLDAQVYQMRQNISETALGDEELTTEKLFAGSWDAVGLGAGAGGALGFGAGAISKVAGKTKAALKAIRDGGVPDQVVDAYAGVSAAVSSAGSKDDIRKLITDRNVRAQWQAKDKILPELSTTIAKSFDDMRSVTGVEKSIFAGEQKAANLASTLRRGNGAEAAQHSAVSQRIDDFGKAIGNHEVVDEVGRRVVRQKPELLDSVVGKSNATELRNIHANAQKLMAKAAKSGDVGTESFLAGEQVKRDLRNLRERTNKSLSAISAPSPTAQRQLRALQDIVSEHEFAAARMLEDADTWGAAGANQAFRNQAFRELQETQKAFDNLFTKPTHEAEQLGGRSGRYHDPGKIGSYVNNLDNAERKLQQEQVGRHLDSREKYLAGLLERGDVPADSVADFQRALESTRNARASFQSATETIGNIHLMDRMLKAENDGVLAVSPLSGAVLGGLVGGHVGAAASLGIAALTRPASMMRQLAVVESMAQRIQRVDKQTSGAIKRHISKLTRVGKGAKLAARGASKLAPPAFARHFGESQSERRKNVERDVRKIEQMMQNPQLSMKRAGALTRGLTDSAPRVTAAMASKHAQAVAFLAEKIPKQRGAPLPFQPNVRRVERQRMTSAEVDKMAKYLTVIKSPQSVLSDLRAGTLTREAVEALSAVWPKFHQEIRVHAMREMANAKNELPFQATLQMSLLLDIPGHPMVMPGFLNRQGLRWDAANAEEEAKAQNNMPPVKMTSVESSATLSEKVAASL